MAGELVPFTIVSPGFFGVNTQDSGVAVPKEFALKAENAMIDNNGRLAARKGWSSIIDSTYLSTATEP